MTPLDNEPGFQETLRKGGAMRPKLTERLVAQMEELKSDGLSNKDICRAVGIHESTLYRWLSGKGKLHRSLAESLKRAEALYKHTLLTAIRESAVKKNGQWTAAAWLLERKYPDEYAQTTRMREEAESAMPKIILGVAVKPSSNDASNERANS